MIHGVGFTMEAFRSHLRQQREDRVGGREKLADLAGVNKTTIQNAEIGPDIPGIDTIARLVEAMDIPLSSFFAQIEGLPVGGDSEDDRGPRKPAVDRDEGLPAIVAADKIEETVIRILARLLARAEKRADAADHRQATSARPEAAERSGNHRKRARRPTRKRRLGTK